MFENRVLRRIFGPKRDEVTRDWRKLHNEEPLAPGFDSASNRNEYQESSWGVMVWPSCKADNLTAICGLTV
jgi:hypothetical protein